MSSKNRKKIGLSDDIPKSTKNDLNIVLKKVQNPKKVSIKSPIKRNCPPPNPSPRTPFKTVNIKRDFVNDVIMTVQSSSNKKQLEIKKGPKMKSAQPVVVVAARTIDKNEDLRPIIGTRSIRKETEHSVNFCDKPKSKTSIEIPKPEIEPLVKNPSKHELKQSQGKINFVEITASGNSLHSASSKSSSLYVSSRGEELRTDRSDSFYDCFESKSSSVLKLFSRKDKHRLWKRDISLCKLLNEEPGPVADDNSEQKINDAVPVHKTFSAHMLNNFKHLLHQHSPNNAAKPQDGILSGEDIEVLKKLVEADERYCYLRQEDHQLLKEVLMEQLKQIELQERVFEATLQKLKQSISSCDVANTETSLSNKEEVNKIDSAPEKNDDKINKVVITPLTVNVDLTEALKPDTEEYSYEMPLVSRSDMFPTQTSQTPSPAAAEKGPVPTSTTNEEQINGKKKVNSQSARNPKIPRLVKKDTFNRQQEVDVVFRNIPTRLKEAKILNVISARLEKAYGKGPTPKMCLEDLGVFLNYVSTKVKEREDDVNKKLKEKLAINKKIIRKKFKIKFEYYAFCQRYITRKATTILICECLSSVKEFVVQYLCMDDIKSAGTFYIFQRRNGYNTDLEEMDFSKLRNQPELLAKMFKSTRSRETDISIFEYETTLEENGLKGHRGWRRHGDSEYSMKQLMYCLFKTWARYPTLYNPRIQPSDIAQQLADSKSMLHFTRTTTITATPSMVSQDGTVSSKENEVLDKDLKAAEFGSQMKKYLVPTVQITLFAIFVLSFVAFEYRCL